MSSAPTRRQRPSFTTTFSRCLRINLMLTLLTLQVYSDGTFILQVLGLYGPSVTFR